MRLDQHSLTPQLLLAKSFHLICSPARCVDLVQGILSRRRALDDDDDDDDAASAPLFIWEPVPDLCTPEELPACYEALKHVDVVSPNHAELCAFFDVKAHHDSGDTAFEAITDCASKFLGSGVGRNGKGAVVVRVGKDGCYTATRDSRRFLPAFHQEGSGKVVDPTGGGNAFLGGFAVGLVRGQATAGITRFEEATLWGAVAASFAIEQVGMPQLGVSADGRETWNGESVLGRLESLKSRLATYVQP